MSRFNGKPEVLESVEGIRLCERDLAIFGDAVHDFSKLHRDRGCAKLHGFAGKPVQGTYLTALAGRVSRDIVSQLHAADSGLIPVEQRSKFPSPVYPGQKITWEKHIDGLKYRLGTPDLKGATRAEIITNFSDEFQKPPKQSGRLIYSEHITITPEESERFYECLRENPKSYVDFSHAAARIPSTLLSILDTLNKTARTNILGINRRTHSHCHGITQPGPAKVDIYLVRQHSSEEGTSYRFHGILTQQRKPKVSTTINTTTNQELDLSQL